MRHPVRALALFLFTLVCSIAPVVAGVAATEIGRLDLPNFEAITNPGDIFGEYPHQPALDGTTLYLPIGTFGDGFLIIDLADPASPRFLNQYSVIRSRDIAVRGSMLYSVDGNAVSVLDITDRSHPVLRGTLSLNSSSGAAAATVDVSGTVAFVTGGGPFLGNFPALRAVDVSNPGAPRALGGSAESGGADVTVSGSLAYVASYGAGLRIYDVSNPSALRLVGSTGTLGDAAMVRLDGNRAYIFNTGSGFSLAIVDVSDPALPTVLKVLTIPREMIADEFGFFDTVFLGIQVAGDRVYLTGWHGVIVVDVSDVQAPVALGTIGPDEFTGGVNLLNGLVVAASRTGIIVLRPGASPTALGGPTLDDLGRLGLDGTPSTDPDGSVVGWTWHLQSRDPDGPSLDLEGPVVSLAGAATGVYDASLMVRDNEGNSSEPYLFPIAVPATADPADLSACRAQVSDLEGMLDEARERIGQLEADLADSATLLAEIREIDRQLRQQNDLLTFDVSEGLKGLQEIQLLLLTPSGQRRSVSDYGGSLGDRLDAIIRMLISPTGQTKK